MRTKAHKRLLWVESRPKRHRSDPRPYPVLVGEIFIAERSLEICFFPCNDLSLHNRDDYQKQDQGGQTVQKEGKARVSQRQSQIHWIASPAVDTRGHQMRRWLERHDRGAVA